MAILTERSESAMKFSRAAWAEVCLFRRQFLQLLDPKFLVWPSPDSLRNAEVQEWLYEQCFQGEENSFLPPERYRLRVLKPLLAKIENSLADPDEDEISDNLMSALPELMYSPLPDESTAAQQKSWVTYALVSPTSSPSPREPCVKLLENRSVISGAGTTGLRTWEAALHLATYLITKPEARELIKGKRVLELGAGTGLLSLMCAGHLGAEHVIATDGDDGVVDALKGNAAFNEAQAQLNIGVLWWGRALKDSWIAQDFGPPGCDLVLGADVTYDKSVIPSLVSTMRDAFELWPKVKIIVSATIRNSDTFAAFEVACNHNDFAVEDLCFPSVPMREQRALFHSTDVPIRILLITAPKIIKDPFAV